MNNLEFRLNVISKYDIEEKKWEIEIWKEVLPYDASNELFPDKDYMRAFIRIFEGENLIYEKFSPSSMLYSTDEKYIIAELKFSLQRLAIASLLPHIRNGFNPDFIINSIIDYTKDKNAFKNYIELADKIRLKYQISNDIA